MTEPKECNGPDRHRFGCTLGPKPLDEIRDKLKKGYEKLSQGEMSALVDQYWIDSFEASQKDQKR